MEEASHVKQTNKHTNKQTKQHVLKAGHPGVPSYVYICLFVRDMVGWVILLSFLSYLLKLVCYAHVFPCTTATTHTFSCGCV